jgi:histone acetyltransferase
MTCADYGVSEALSPRALSFRQYDKELDYRVIHNDSSRQALVWLLMARNVFHQQLGNMPEYYITRLVFNEHHRTVLLLRDGVVLGGVTFRPFTERTTDPPFAEIAFCAISTQEQIRGFGSHVMAHVKTYLQAIGVHHILTYADNSAIGYFQRQGFTREINLNPATWRRCIKDYQGATLIHCKIMPDVDYLRINDVIAQQKRLVASLLPDYDVETVTSFPVKQIRGIKIGKAPEIDFTGQLLWIVDKLKIHSKAWPFLKPVNADEAPHYYEIITSPMDLRTLETNVREGKYRDMEEFVRAVRLIFSNCLAYNRDGESVYSRSARELEGYFDRLMEENRAGRLR